MPRPRAKELPVYTKTRFRKLKDGTTSVVSIEYRYDYTLKNYKTLSTKTIGYLPEGSTDIEDMIPVENPKRGPKPGTRKKKKPEVKISADNPLLEVKDPRDPDKIVYPSYLAYLVLMMCAGSGMSTCPQVAQFWEVHHEHLKKLFEDCPDRLISHDTVRDFYFLLGKTNFNGVIKSFTAMFLLEDGVMHELEKMNSPEAMEAFHRSIYALDGQAVRATKINAGGKHPKYTLSVFDCSKEIVLAQELVDEKSNEIPQVREMVKTIDVRGGILTADAMHCQTPFFQAAIDAGADVCVQLKENQKLTIEDVRSKFNLEKYSELVVEDNDDGVAHGRIERRVIRVLPGNILEPEILEKWPGLEDGCIAELRSTRVIGNLEKNDKTEEIRYYITTLEFKKEYIAKQLLYVIRSHWKIENKLHWVLDVTFQQDMIHCKNNDFLKGRMALNKLMYNFETAVVRLLEKERGHKVSRQSLKPIFTDVSYFLSMISKVCIGYNNGSIS